MTTTAMNIAAPAGPAIRAVSDLDAPSHADEMNHRIANNLQLLSALVSLEARGIRDPEALAVLDTTRRRIGAIASVHRQLCQTRSAAMVELGGYLATLARDLEASVGSSIAGRRILVRAADIEVRPEEATSIGILVAELVANACKYAYPAGAPGDIRIGLRGMVLGGYRLEVEDRGCGLAGGGAHGSGLGRRLIESLATQLGAQHAWRDAFPGTSFVLWVARR